LQHSILIGPFCKIQKILAMLKIKESDVTIMVKDMDKAIDFYKNIGLTLQERWGDHYARVVSTGITLGIHPGGTSSSGSGTVSIGFLVDDINDAKAVLEQHQVLFKAEEGKSGKFLHFKDPDGTVLYFMQSMY
jgi:predicted enzyme related to lactoylglutathione lyase